MRIDFDASDPAVLDGLLHYIVDLDLTTDAYPSRRVFVLRVEPGQLVVLRTDGQGRAIFNPEFLIPTGVIRGAVVRG